jgi:hypothetical protein
VGLLGPEPMPGVPEESINGVRLRWLRTRAPDTTERDKIKEREGREALHQKGTHCLRASALLPHSLVGPIMSVS